MYDRNMHVLDADRVETRDFLAHRREALFREWIAPLGLRTERPAQITLGGFIFGALADQAHAAVQAPTGTGKSFAYLIPAIAHAVHGDKRVIIALKTKQLQDQVAEKDLAFLRDRLSAAGVDFKYAVLKGRANYICLNRTRHAIKRLEDDPRHRDLVAVLEAVTASSVRGVGERGDVGVLALRRGPLADAAWRLIRSDAEDCSALGCTDDAELTCYHALARKRAAEAQIVVVNTALLGAHLQMLDWGLSLLGEFDVLVLDEAHGAYEAIADGMGQTITPGSFEQAALDAINYAATISRTSVERVTDAWSNSVRPAMAELFSSGNRPCAEARSIPAGPVGTLLPIAQRIAAGLRLLLSAVPAPLTEDREDQREYRTVLRRVGKSARTAQLLVRALDPEDTGWVAESELDDADRHVIRMSPIDIRQQFGDLADGPTVIFVSATLAAPGAGLSVVPALLGVPTVRELRLDTAADLHTRQLMYLTPRTASENDRGRLDASVNLDEIERLVRAAGGRALVLTPTKTEVGLIAERLMRAGFRVHRQRWGSGQSNAEVAEAFREDVRSVLVGSMSFYEGVDFPGETCSLVVIARLPWPPDAGSQKFQARSRLLQRVTDAEIGFAELQMLINVQQQAGRLIRSEQDRGVVAVLDPRVRSRRSAYGPRVLGALSTEETVWTSNSGDVHGWLAGQDEAVAA